MSDNSPSYRHFLEWLKSRFGAFCAWVTRRWDEEALNDLQECVLKILKGEVGNASFTSPEHVERWLCKCVRYRVITRLRKKRVAALSAQDPTSLTQPNLHDFDWLQRAICACYLDLNDSRNDVLRRFYLLNQEVKEIASELNLTKEAVKARLFQARRQLRECLEQKGVSYQDLIDVALYLAVFDCESSTPLEDAP